MNTLVCNLTLLRLSSHTTTSMEVVIVDRSSYFHSPGYIAVWEHGKEACWWCNTPSAAKIGESNGDTTTNGTEVSEIISISKWFTFNKPPSLQCLQLQKNSYCLARVFQFKIRGTQNERRLYIYRWLTSSSFCCVGLCFWQWTSDVQASGSPQSQHPPPPEANSCKGRKSVNSTKLHIRQ